MSSEEVFSALSSIESEILASTLTTQKLVKDRDKLLFRIGVMEITLAQKFVYVRGVRMILVNK